MLGSARVLVVSVCLVFGCGDDGGGGATDAQSSIDAGDCSDSRVFFLNRGGGSYTPGMDDSSANVSGVLSGPATVDPWTVGDTDWNDLIACIRSKFAAYNVEVTDVDPGAATHVEAVFVGNPQQVPPLDNAGVTGVSPFNCSEIRRAVILLNPLSQADTTARCENAAHVLGASVGLDKTYHCPDLMTFLSGCGEKSFVDMDMQCGEYEARACDCGGTTQNSHQLLTERLGAACGP
jgi:hypothetical protein